MELFVSLGRLPTAEEHNQVEGPQTFRHIKSLLAVGYRSEKETINGFYASDWEYYFTAGEFVWGCARSAGSYVVVTVGY